MSDYIRWEGKVRETGTRVQILDCSHPDTEFGPELDADGKVVNRWATICMDHSWIVTHPTSTIAWDMAAHPLVWCERCAGTEPVEVEEPAPATPKRSRKATNELGLPQKSFEFFKDLAEDAGNWAGHPWLSGNVASGRSASGMSQTLVRAGLIEVHSDYDGEGPFATFTPAGIEAAAKVGIDLSWIG